jgi:OOP family OmpA-OmpF porin
MRTTFIKQQFGLAVACALALGVLSGTAAAQVQPDEKALVTDTRGFPVKSGSGLCVHSTFGPPPAWTQECHPYAPYEKVVFDTNILFDSDRSALRPAGRDKLDQLADKIHGLDSQSIVAVGYADRMGTDASNQALSRQRVDTVKAYLVGKGIASNRVETSAKGETRPSTYAGECGDANNAKNVACMQPDRHVFVEVSGTRLKQ